ncbi:MAG: RING finger protein, partial [Candidatus Xenobia bacterium]
MPLLTLAYLKCFECNNKWIEFQDRSPGCPACESPVTSEPVFISHIRRAVEVLEEEYLNLEIDDEAYEARGEYLRGMYLDAVPVILKRVGQILTLAMGDLEQGNMSDSVISRLYLADLGFLELGMPLAAAICSGIIACSLATRHYDGKFSNDGEELQRLSRSNDGPFAGRSLPHFQILLRLSDMTRAIEWAHHLSQPRWEAMFRILSAVATVRDAAALPPAKAEPLCVLSWHQLQLAMALARRNMYFYLLPMLEHHVQEACNLLRTTRDEAVLTEQGSALLERLEADLLIPGRDAL